MRTVQRDHMKTAKATMKKPFRFKLEGTTFQIDSNQTVWKLGKTQRGHEAFHLMMGPDADYVLKHGRKLQWKATT